MAELGGKEWWRWGGGGGDFLFDVFLRFFLDFYCAVFFCFFRSAGQDEMVFGGSLYLVPTMPRPSMAGAQRTAFARILFLNYFFLNH